MKHISRLPVPRSSRLPGERRECNTGKGEAREHRVANHRDKRRPALLDDVIGQLRGLNLHQSAGCAAGAVTIRVWINLQGEITGKPAAFHAAMPPRMCAACC